MSTNADQGTTLRAVIEIANTVRTLQDLEREGKYTLARVARRLKVTRKSLLNWEAAGKIPKALREQRGRLQYRYYTDKEIKVIKQFIQSRIPGSDTMFLYRDADGNPVYGKRMRGIAIEVLQEQAEEQQGSLFPNVGQVQRCQSLDEALSAVWIAAFRIGATTITLRNDSDGREHTVRIQAADLDNGPAATD